MNALLEFAETLFSRLAWTSAQAVVFIAVVWLIGRLRPSLPAAARSMMWWLLGLQLILGLTLAAPVRLPLLTAPSPALTTATAPALVPHAVDLPPAPAIVTPASKTVAKPAPIPVAAQAATFARTHWRLALVSLWLAGVLVQLLMLVHDWRKARSVLRDATALHDPVLQALCAQQAHALGLRRVPALRVSRAIGSPQVTGWWRSTILLPADHTLTPQESSLALAHELTHVQRGDLWMSWIPAIAQRLFFFHPLVAWAVREYALSREAACDAQVLQQTGAVPQAYGRLLLRLGVAHPVSSGLAGASPSFQNLKRRLTMLQQTDNLPRQRVRGWLLIGAIALLGVLPYRVTARNATSADAAASAQAASVPASPAAPLPALPPPPPPPPAPPMPPVPLPPPPKPPHEFSARHVDIDTHDHAANGFALLDKDSVIVNGSNSDADALQRLRKGDQAILWFRRGDKAYVVRDEATIQRAKAIYAPVSELGQRQGELGGEQGRLGGLQGGLGARQGELGARQGRLAADQARLTALTALGDTHHGEADAQRAKVEADEQALGREQDELAKQQDELAKQQDALGAKQDALGKQQDAAVAKANQQIKQLIDEALAKGLAQTVSAG